MATVTTAQLQAYLTQLYAARDALLVTGQAYNVMGRNLTRADARWVSDEIEKTEGRLSRRAGPLSADIIIDPR
jgi:hypothetical protein